MITADDVAKLVGDRLQATSSFVLSVPGGIWNQRANNTPSNYPYAVAKYTAAPPIASFDDVYCQAWTVQIAAYCPIGIPGLDPAAVQQALFAGLCTEAAMAALQATGLRNATEHVMHSIALPPTGEFDPRLREGRDVFVAGLSVEIMVQGDRSVT